MAQKVDNKKVLGKVVIILVIFSVLCFATSFYLNSKSGEIKTHIISAKGGEVALNVNNGGSMYKMDISQSVYTNSWSYVNVTVEDGKRDEMYSFGAELWSESGYDEGEYWSESSTDFENKVYFKKTGKYYLVFEPEASDANTAGDVVVRIKRVKGSDLPHFIVGIFALLIAFILNEIVNRSITKYIF